MTREEFLLLELCKEVLDFGLHRERFTELWLESGLQLDEVEMDIAYKLWQRHEGQNKVRTYKCVTLH